MSKAASIYELVGPLDAATAAALRGRRSRSRLLLRQMGLEALLPPRPPVEQDPTVLAEARGLAALEAIRPKAGRAA